MAGRERQIQTACVNWFRLKHGTKARIFAVPNGGSRHKIEAINLKREGVTAGVLDLVVAYPVGEFGGLFIEMKADAGKLTKEQKDWSEYLRGVGYAVAACWTVDEFMATVGMYMKGVFNNKQQEELQKVWKLKRK